MTTVPATSLVFVHSSDELYGADRVLLELLDAVPASVRAEVWLPTDLPHPPAPLCAELQRRGHGVRHVDVPVLRRAYRRPAALLRLALRVVRLAVTLRRSRPDIVYFTTSAAFLGVPAARLARVGRVVGHVQEVWTPGDARVLAPFARRADQVIATSQAVVDEFPPALAPRASVIANATPDPGPTPSLDEHTGPLRYVIASRWTPRKGYGTLLDAWDAAGCPGLLTVLGGPPASGARYEVVQRVAALSDPESVRIVGEVPDPSAYLLDADIVLVPSDEPESFGLVAIEAFARGRPVLAAAAGGLAEVVTDVHDGWLFPPRDTAALTGLLRRLDRGDATVAGVRARETYTRRYTADRLAQDWRDRVLGDAAVGSGRRA